MKKTKKSLFKVPIAEFSSEFIVLNVFKYEKRAKAWNKKK